MGKTLKQTTFCKLSEKMLAGQGEAYLALATKPRYICRRCFRLANKKRNLCKPEKIKDYNIN